MTIRVGGNIIAGAATELDKANTDMDNLTSQGQNIANWSNNVTNCITEIPQDIKLELKDGVLTLKAGSKVYIPNGFETSGTPTVKLYAWTRPDGFTYYTKTPTPHEGPSIYDSNGIIYPHLSLTSVGDGNITIRDDYIERP